MRWRYILNVVGTLSFFLGLTMLFPLFCALFYQDTSTVPLIQAIAVTLIAGGLLNRMFRGQKTDYISQREGMAIVALGWTAAGVWGALPFYFSGYFPSFTDALFESVSGFTTTGASILVQIETIPRGLLFWRSFIQWLGGMGIIVLSIAILPFVGIGGMQLYKAEVPSPVPDKLKPRIRDTAMVLWKVYALISLLEVLLLLVGGMDLFDALCHAFTTMPTGGFSTRNASIAAYDSTYMEVVIILFMGLAGVNFALHYAAIRGKPLAFWRDSECRFFLFTLLFFSILVSADLYRGVYESLWEALRFGTFQVVSIVTTTGYVTADYEAWPAMSQLILLLSMFLGASAGSTGGGMKILRIMLCFKFCYKELFSIIHPRSVKQIKIGGSPVSDEVMRSVMGFLALYVGLFSVCSVLLAGTGVDFVTAFGAVAATIGNIGPGFGLVGPVENYAQLPLAGKWILVWCMLLGRLEIFTVVIFLVPEFWRK